VSGGGAAHRTTDELHALVVAVVDASAHNNSDRVKELLAPLFLTEDGCCLYAVTGGLLETIKKAMPPVATERLTATVMAQAAGSLDPAEYLWALMLVAHLRGNPGEVLSLFQQGAAGSLMGPAIAVGVVEAGRYHRARVAAAQ
jgi:hypothetical protein